MEAARRGGGVDALISSRGLSNFRLPFPSLTHKLSNRFLSTFPGEKRVGNTLRKYLFSLVFVTPLTPNIPIIPPHKSRLKLRPEFVAPFLSFPSAPVRWSGNVNCNVAAFPSRIPGKVYWTIIVVITPLKSSLVTKIWSSDPKLGESYYLTNLTDSFGDPSAFLSSSNAQ